MAVKNVRYGACEVLGNIGKKAATNEVITKLVSALGDKNEDVRSKACEALGQMGEKAEMNRDATVTKTGLIGNRSIGNRSNR